MEEQPSTVMNPSYSVSYIPAEDVCESHGYEQINRKNSQRNKTMVGKKMVCVSMCIAALSTIIAVFSLCLVAALSLWSTFQTTSEETQQQDQITLIQNRLDKVNNTLFSHVNFNKVAFESLNSTVQSLLGSSTPISTDQSEISSLLHTVPKCGPGTWHRIIYLNMSDSSQQCPPAWREYTTPVRSCGRPVTSSRSCPSTVFSVGAYPFPYSKVCGRVIGYQYTSPDGFSTTDAGRQQTVLSADDIYMDGISVTHGNPRVHIWTFAAGYTERLNISNDQFGCPCASSSANSSPSFVGENYFCESGTTREPFLGDFFLNDPLWDGEGCINSDCCTFNSPPWFSVQLPSFTTDDIEVRICGDEGTTNEDTPVQLLEIYIQI